MIGAIDISFVHVDIEKPSMGVYGFLTKLPILSKTAARFNIRLNILMGIRWHVL